MDIATSTFVVLHDACTGLYAPTDKLYFDDLIINGFLTIDLDEWFFPVLQFPENVYTAPVQASATNYVNVLRSLTFHLNKITESLISEATVVRRLDYDDLRVEKCFQHKLEYLRDHYGGEKSVFYQYAQKVVDKLPQFLNKYSNDNFVPNDARNQVWVNNVAQWRELETALRRRRNTPATVGYVKEHVLGMDYNIHQWSSNLPNPRKLRDALTARYSIYGLEETTNTPLRFRIRSHPEVFKRKYPILHENQVTEQLNLDVSNIYNQYIELDSTQLTDLYILNMKNLGKNHYRTILAARLLGVNK